jgi:hypothetical protein
MQTGPEYPGDEATVRRVLRREALHLKARQAALAPHLYAWEAFMHGPFFVFHCPLKIAQGSFAYRDINRHTKDPIPHTFCHWQGMMALTL